MYVWGIAARRRARSLLRIEDHDRPAVAARVRGGAARGPRLARARARRAGVARSRQPDAVPPVRRGPYAAALDRLRERRPRLRLRLLAVDVRGVGARARPAVARARAVPAAAASEGSPRTRARPAGRARGGRGALDGPAGSGRGRRAGGAAATRSSATATGNWTYGFCVVVDDLRQGVDLVIRGRDLLDATPARSALARLLGRETPPTFAHHPLVRRVSGQKLSKADGDTAVRALLDAGSTPAELFGLAARLAGLRRGAPDRTGRSRVPVRGARRRQSARADVRAAAIWAAHSAARTPPWSST